MDLWNVASAWHARGTALRQSWFAGHWDLYNQVRLTDLHDELLLTLIFGAAGSKPRDLFGKAGNTWPGYDGGDAAIYHCIWQPAGSSSQIPGRQGLG